MEIYGNSENSGVQGFEIGKDYITVWFHVSGVYTYSYSRPGRTHVEKMKTRAQDGIGLNAYINKYVRGNYLRKNR